MVRVWGVDLSDIFQEVQEDVRSAQLRALWDRYGILVIGGVVALIAGVAITVYWQDQQREKREAAAERFLAGEKLLLEGDKAGAVEHFTKFSQEAVAVGYAFLSRMKEAAAQVEAGNLGGAVAVYDALASDSRFDALHRDLAALKAAMLLADSASPDELRLRFAPLAKSENPWRHSAREQLAFMALQAGEIDQARSNFQALADDLSAPNGIRGRAAEILSTFPAVAPVQPDSKLPDAAPAAGSPASSVEKK